MGWTIFRQPLRPCRVVDHEMTVDSVPTWVIAVLASCWSAAGCGEQTIRHQLVPMAGTDGFGAFSGGVTTFAGSSGGFGGGQFGNYPEPALTRCGALPDGVVAMDDLFSAWAVLALPGATDVDDQEVEPGLLRLRLSALGITDCAGTPDMVECSGSDPEDSACGWDVEISLPPSESEPGTIDLANETDADYNVRGGQRDATRLDTSRGSLVIHSVTPDCVIGEFVDVDTTANDSGLPLNGGFVAEICQRQCIPSQGRGC